MNLQISKKITINQSSENIYKVISDITKWNIWSPWMHCEPTATTVSDGLPGQTGQTQSWKGEVIGSGKMTIVALEKNKIIKMKLEFFTPWKNQAESVFEIKENDQSLSEVTWTMNSNLPIFMFFFKNMMMAYISSDFERGLKMLKEYAETGLVISKSVFQGEKNFSEFYVLGKKTSCRISEISTNIKSDFENLNKLFQQGEIYKPDTMITLSNKHDIPKGVCEFTAGYCYQSNQNLKIPHGYQLQQISSHKGLLVDHFGPYRNIGNPWSMIVSYQRGQKKKILKNIPSYEVYKTMPDGRPEKDIYTQIIMPIK